MSERRAGHRGSIVLYGLAFALLIVSTWFLFKGNTESSLRFVWTSIGVSGLALVVAITSLVLYRR